jgi:DNA-binding IclR family transcriptional regulator
MKPATVGAGRVYSSQVLDRVVRILTSFSSDRQELGLIQIAEATGLHKSTCYRLLEAMRTHGLIGLNKTTGTYHPGMKLFELGSLAVGRLKLDKHAHPLLEELSRVTGETAHLCVLDGSDVVYVAKVESNRALRIPSAVGARNPAYCTGVGKAMLAHLTPGQLDGYLSETQLRAFTKKTLVSAFELKANLCQIAAQGYAIDDQEREDGVRCVAAPVRDHTGQVVAAVSIAAPSMRVTKERVPELTIQVMRAAAEISSELGHRSINHTANGAKAGRDGRTLPRLSRGIR